MCLQFKEMCRNEAIGEYFLEILILYIRIGNPVLSKEEGELIKKLLTLTALENITNSRIIVHSYGNDHLAEQIFLLLCYMEK